MHSKRNRREAIHSELHIIGELFLFHRKHSRGRKAKITPQAHIGIQMCTPNTVVVRMTTHHLRLNSKTSVGRALSSLQRSVSSAKLLMRTFAL
eukprot:3033125-Amphidinium_carterae.1